MGGQVRGWLHSELLFQPCGSRLVPWDGHTLGLWHLTGNICSEERVCSCQQFEKAHPCACLQVTEQVTRLRITCQTSGSRAGGTPAPHCPGRAGGSAPGCSCRARLLWCALVAASSPPHRHQGGFLQPPAAFRGCLLQAQVSDCLRGPLLPCAWREFAAQPPHRRLRAQHLVPGKTPVSCFTWITTSKPEPSRQGRGRTAVNSDLCLSFSPYCHQALYFITHLFSITFVFSNCFSFFTAQEEHSFSLENDFNFISSIFFFFLCLQYTWLHIMYKTKNRPCTEKMDLQGTVLVLPSDSCWNSLRRARLHFAVLSGRAEEQHTPMSLILSWSSGPRKKSQFKTLGALHNQASRAPQPQ